MTTRWRLIDTRSSAMAVEGAVIWLFVEGFATCEGARVDLGLAHAVMPDERTQANDNSLRDPRFLGSSLYLLVAKPVAAAQTEQPSVVFNADGTVQVPTGFRKWVFVGAPLTPEGLNDGKYNCNAAGANCTRSNFPEYHHVYVPTR